MPKVTTVIGAIFPWCFTLDLYAARPDYIRSLADFVRSRPAQTVEAFIEQSNAVIGHDVSEHLARISAPTQITFGGMDLVTSTRFADQLRGQIRQSELLIFDGCAHAALYEKVDEFNQKTLQFLQRQTGATAAYESV
jgi:3-oxoadipate enol-lactonase